VRLPRHRIWPILPGVRSFLNCVGSGALDGGCRGGRGWKRYLCGNVLLVLLAQGALRGVVQLAFARSGMKRSPRHSTSLEVMMWICADSCAGVEMWIGSCPGVCRDGRTNDISGAQPRRDRGRRR